MKKLEISRLMDEYQDNELFPEGGSTVDAENVKGLVLAKAAPAKGKRRVPSWKAALLAAALAVGCVLMIAAGVPQLTYRLLTGTVTVGQDEDGRIVDFQLDSIPVELEDGRLYFVGDGQRTDITDLIDMDTPYIYRDNDPIDGTIHYLLVGGTPECYGWLEWFEVPQFANWNEEDLSRGVDAPAAVAYTVKIITENGEPSSRGSGTGGCAFGLHKQYHYTWLKEALDTVGILIEYGIEWTETGIYFCD